MEALEAWFKDLPVALNLLFFAAGAVMIWQGADRLLDSAVLIARTLRAPKVLVGATLVSVLTTLPEFAVSFSAALLNHGQTAVGNALGSVACNTGLIMGVALLFRSVVAERRLVIEQGAFLIVSAALLTALTFGGVLSGWGAAALVGMLIGYIVYSVFAAFRSREEAGVEDKPIRAARLERELAILAAGGVLVGLGSVLLVQNGVKIAHWLGVPELIIALTMVALGTSLPELVVAVAGLVKRQSEVSVGNIIGANFLDFAWVLGACGLVTPLELTRQTRVLDMPFVLLLVILLIVFAFTGRRLRRAEGAALLAIYVVYLALMFALFAGAG